MANFNLYSASCVLLLLTLSLGLSRRAASGHPLPSPGAGQAAGQAAGQGARCPPLFRTLLSHISELLSGDVLCYAITSDKVVVSRPETAEACAPALTQNSGCMLQRNSPFNEHECLRNIMKDLAFFNASIASYLTSPLRSPEKEVKLLSPILEIMKSLKNYSLIPNEDTDSSEVVAAQVWGNDTYSNRQEMCKMMRGFYVRTITINRAMGYISSGDHKK